MTPDYFQDLLSPEQQQQVRWSSIGQGLLGASQALARSSAPSLMPQGSGFADALGAFNQGYQGSIDSTLQNIARGMQLKQAMEKQQKEKQFNERIAKAMSTRPVGTGLTMSGDGSQQQMLLDQIQGFGDEGMKSTIGALQSNVNLPKQTVLDQSQFMSALAQYSPLEYAKLTMKSEDKPDALKTFEAFSKMTAPQQQEFLKFRASGQPQQNVTLGEKIADKVVGERIGEFSSSAASARRFAQDARTINNLLVGKGGGEIVKVGTSLAKDLGLSNESIAAQDLANSIATRGATTMRPAGSGSTSDIEFKAYTMAFPSLANSEAGRRFMADAADKFAERNAKLADYAMKLSRKGEYSEEAMAAFDRSLGSVLDMNELDKIVKTTPSKGGKRDFRTGQKG